MNSDLTRTTEWCENIIIADADHIDKVAFDLIVNFERMLMRRIPQADMARWIDCIALDGGVREGDNHTQVVLIHDKAHARMDNFAPSVHASELDGKAFSDTSESSQSAPFQWRTWLVRTTFYAKCLPRRAAARR